jgi:glucose/arabinose dehydrogenase
MSRSAFCASLALVLVLPVAAGCAPGSGARAAVDSSDVFTPATGLRLVEVAHGLDRPLYVTAPAGDPRLFIVEQGGRVKIVKDGRVLARPFIDLSDRLRSGGERGLLSIAFHPAYARSGSFFVNYTDKGGNTRVERYQVTRDPDVADPASAQLVLAVDQPYANHNGGHILFGPDGHLYVGMGDGGAGGDPHGNGQNPRALLGKLLRIDVDAPAPRADVWAIGLRNPWRFAFDPPSGLLYVADVGQDKWEEVDVAPLATQGLNYGWNIMEGKHDYARRGRPTHGLVRPIVEYGHGDGCSITGGFVYRGRAIPDLAGTYFFSDYCQGWIRSFRMSDGRAVERREWRGLDAGSVTSFGLDGAGELYVTNMNGMVYRFARARAAGG